MLHSCCHCVCQYSVLPCAIQLPMLYSCPCCTVAATMYATVSSVAACRTFAHVAQLLPLCMPVFCDAMCRTVACTVYVTVSCVAVQLLYAVQLMPFYIPVFHVAMCRSVAYSCCHCVHHSVMCCHFPCSCFMLYS